VSENVKKIFIVLITIVACVLIGAFLLNILMPNVTTTVINATEDMIFRATGLSFDFNKDTIKGGINTQYEGTQDGKDGTGVDNVDGFWE